MNTNHELHNVYCSVLGGRYASKEMQQLFSERQKVLYWRQLWTWLAEAQMVSVGDTRGFKVEKQVIQELGLTIISEEQINDMKEHAEEIDWALVKTLEKQMRHDVMAHVHAFERVAVKAKGIIHLGATSAYVQDNADLLTMRCAIDNLLKRVKTCLHRLRHFAVEHKHLATVGRTHYQPASLTTVGKRAALWAQDLLIAFEHLSRARSSLLFRGAKGATGTQNSFLILFNNNAEKVEALDRKVSAKAGFGSEDMPEKLIITGQTYTRMQDCSVLCSLGMIGAAVHKVSMDIRMLQCFGEISEPFENSQVGSSAMPYKRNPMRSERCCGLARFLINLIPNCFHTEAIQGFERTLDDSSNRRLLLPEAFLTTDALLITFQNVLESLRVNHSSIAAHVEAELPFLSLESVLMHLTLHGVDRQIAHEKIRCLALMARKEREQTGKNIDLSRLLAEDEFFEPIWPQLGNLLGADHHVGLCARQVDEFVRHKLEPIFKSSNNADLFANTELDV
ncbi:adenylosuccinate lyase [Trichuris trichiura]|uniref:Adenylosuccinate lyase n=1 Tax=Trichuris trichiura TaxID=36087 RepID=A0A077Z539_TRITR|nr:adenylosuccinate lyase [Trichuris trichiura]